MKLTTILESILTVVMLHTVGLCLNVPSYTQMEIQRNVVFGAVMG